MSIIIYENIPVPKKTTNSEVYSEYKTTMDKLEVGQMFYIPYKERSKIDSVRTTMRQTTSKVFTQRKLFKDGENLL